MNRGLTATFGIITALGAGLIVFLIGLSPSNEALRLPASDGRPKEAGGTKTTKGDLSAAQSNDASSHHNIHGLTVYPLDANSLEKNTTIIEFSLRRKAALDVYALGENRRKAFTLLEEVEFDKGTHRIPAAKIIQGRGALKSGSYFIGFAEKGNRGQKEHFNHLSNLEWDEFPQNRIQVSEAWSRIQYELREPSLVRIRICTASGFVLDTVVNGEFRNGGVRVERWRRRDPTGRVLFSGDVGYVISMDVARPPVNHLRIDLTPPSGPVPTRDPRIGRNLPEAGREMDHGKTLKPVPTRETRADFCCLLDLEDWKLRDGKVKGDASFKIDMLTANERMKANEKFSLKIYLDLNPVHEEREITLPYSHERRFDKEREGMHVLSIMISDSKGNVGLSSIPFAVDHGKNSE